MLEPSVPALNPFSHDRRKTFQPRDLWEALIKFAILLFILDVGVRRIQIDRDEWERLLRRVAFWQKARPATADDSLTALLARRDQVRSTKTAAAEPKPELFRPEKIVTEVSPAGQPGSPSPGVAPPEPEPKTTETTEPPSSTTSRLLEAKRRAQQRKGGKP
jgi:hypothetical protein